jgi:hypothetical protein
MDCDKFWELIESGRKLSLVEQAAVAAHESECASCRADRAALEEAEDDDEIPDVSPETLKKEVDAIFAKAAAQKAQVAAPIAPAEIKTPRRVWFGAVAMAACLVVGLGVGFLGGWEARPGETGGHFTGFGGTLGGGDELTRRLVLARVALELGLKEDAHEIARKILAMKDLPPPVKRDAEEILNK